MKFFSTIFFFICITTLFFCAHAESQSFLEVNSLDSVIGKSDTLPDREDRSSIIVEQIALETPQKSIVEDASTQLFEGVVPFPAFDLTPETRGPSITIRPYGYILAESFLDTRQVFAEREGYVLFWPLRYCPDVRGKDINAHAHFNMLPIETRIGLNFTCDNIWPDVRTIGIIETDFIAHTESVLNHLRMRHAYIQIDLERIRASLLFGQFWDPLFVIDCSPNTISYNTGIPMEPFARNPQIRYTQLINNIELAFTVLTQYEFVSNGPCGPTSDYLRNAIVPNLNLRLKYYIGDKSFIGVSGDYLRLVPRIVTEKKVKVNETINSGRTQIFARLQVDNLLVNTALLYFQNGFDQSMISGYAIKTVDPVTDYRTYANTAAVAWWLDATYFLNCPRIELGIFGGWTKNLGSRDRLFIDPKRKKPIIYSLDPKLDYVARLSPRILIKRDPIRIGLEAEWTRAAFGKIDKFGRIVHARPVNNVRFVFAIFYFF